MSGQITIILAEDDDGHATLIRRNLERAKLNAQIVRLRDGLDVVEYLAGDGGQPALSPALLLLDIHMPRLDGIETLRRLKSDPATKTIPVYMLTTVENPREVERCFELGCNAFIIKPVAYASFVASIQRLCSFLEVTTVPGTHPQDRYNA